MPGAERASGQSRDNAIIRDRAELLRQIDEIEADGEVWSAVLVVTDTPPPIRQLAEGCGAATACVACGRPFARTSPRQRYCQATACQTERRRRYKLAYRQRKRGETP